MTLTAADVAEIMRLVEESTFDELVLEVDGLKLSFKRGSGGESVPVRSSAAPSLTTEAAQPPAMEVAPAVARTPVSPAANADPNLHEVTAPLLGTFYRAPKPGAPPFVEVGSAVEEDTVICIIEVMKLMNTVRASVRGIVTQILTVDGALVEYGETLIRVRKTV